MCVSWLDQGLCLHKCLDLHAVVRCWLKNVCCFLVPVCNSPRRLIGVTEPRRVAAMSMSKRVGEEMGLGQRYEHDCATVLVAMQHQHSKRYSCFWKGPVWICHKSREFATQRSHSVDWAGWQAPAKIYSIELWMPWRNVHRPSCHSRMCSPTANFQSYLFLPPVSFVMYLVMLQPCVLPDSVWRQYYR